MPDIEALLASAKEAPENSRAIRNLPRASIVVAEKVFQWRLIKEDVGARDDHVLDLANTIAASGRPLDAILVFEAGDKFYVVDGHHRIAAYDTVRWSKVIPVAVVEGSLECPIGVARDVQLPNPAADADRWANRMGVGRGGSQAGHRHPARAAEATSDLRGVFGSGIC